MLRDHGLFNIHHFQRLEDICPAYERPGLFGLLYLCMSFLHLTLPVF